MEKGLWNLNSSVNPSSLFSIQTIYRCLYRYIWLPMMNYQMFSHSGRLIKIKILWVVFFYLRLNSKALTYSFLLKFLTFESASDQAFCDHLKGSQWPKRNKNEFWVRFPLLGFKKCLAHKVFPTGHPCKY